MNIAISGELGSGKSSIAKELIRNYLKEYEIISAGKINRQEAEKRGLSTRQFNELLQSDEKFDNWLDDKIKSYGDEGSNYIFDARLGWLFVSKAFKIHLLCRPEIAATRVADDKSRVGEQYQKSSQALSEISKRKESERKRFQEFYGVDINDFSNYHLVLDTSDNTVEVITSFLYNQFRKWIENKFDHKCFVSPQAIRNIHDQMSGDLKVKYEDRNYYWQSGLIQRDSDFVEIKIV